jgi:cell division protein FtsL
MMKNVCAIFLALMIPALLLVGVWQSSRYSRLEAEVRALDERQYEVITLNKRLISGISVLSTPERIEKVAVETLGMRKAQAGEIMRIELKKGQLGG